MRRISFEGTDAERAIAHRGSRRRGRVNGYGGWAVGGDRRRLVAFDALQEGRGRGKEKISADRPAEVQEPIVIAGRAADEHVLEHLLDRSWRAGVADEVGPELAL